MSYLGSVVSQAAARFGSTAALVAQDGSTLTYADLDTLAWEVAAGLQRLGVGEGDVVALTLPSDGSYALAYIALARLGAVTVGVNPRLTDSERATALEVVGPQLVLTDQPSAPAPASTRQVGVTAGTDPDTVLYELRSAGSDVQPIPPDTPDLPVAIVLTSGTTGRPKGAVFTDRQIAAVTRYDLGPDAEARWGGGGPMLAGTQFAHVGFMTKFAWYVRTGSTLYLLDRWRASDVLDIVESTGMKAIGGVAPQLALMLRDERFDERDLSSVQTLIMGGGPSSPALVDEARRRFGAGYSIRYSSTESGGVGTGTAVDAGDDEALFSVGRPRPGMELSIRIDERECEPGEVGEVCIRSDAVMAGYWNDPAATAEALRDGWLYTGDLGFIAESGCLVLAGRKKEMYIRGGYNVYPMEVEAILGQHPAVAQVAVAPKSDPVMGETGVAIVVPVDAARPPTLDDLRAFAAGRLSKHKLPEALALATELPLTPGHKLDRLALAAAVEHGLREAPSPPLT